MSSGTTTPKTPTVDPAKAAKQVWLSGIIGGKELYDGTSTLKPLDSAGNPVDLATLEREVNELVKNNPESPELGDKKFLLAQLGVPSASDSVAEFNKKTEAREQALTNLREIIELRKSEVRTATDYEVTVKRRIEIGGKEILFGKKQVSTKSNKQEKEFSEEHYKGRIIQDPALPQRQEAAQAVIQQLLLLTDQLKNNEECAFTPQELMNEMWFPLVREGLISEEQCPDEYSQVLALFQGACKLYNKRLEEQANKPVDKFEDVRNHLDDLSEVLGIGAAAVDLVLSLVGSQDNVQKILALVTKCTQGAMKTTSALLERTSNLEDASSNFADILGSVVTAVVAAKVDKDTGDKIGKLTKGAFQGFANLGLFAKRMAERDYENGLDFLAQAIGTALNCVGEGTQLKPIQELAKHATPALQGLLKGGKIVYLFNQEPVDIKAVQAEIKAVSEKALTHTFNTVFDKTYVEKREKEAEDLADKMKDKFGEESKEYKAAKKEFDELKKTHEDMSEGFEKIFEELNSQSDEAFKTLQGNVESTAVQEGSATAEQELLEQNELFNKRIGAVFNAGVGADDEDAAMIADLYSIDAMIAQIEKDRAVLMMFNIIFDSIGGVVTAFIPQLGGVLKAKAFIMNVIAATERSMDLITFTDMLDDARKARSPQTAPLLAEVDELRRHLTNDTQEAAIALGQAISLSVAAAGDVATAAMGTGAVASLTGRAISSGLDIYKKSKDLLKKKFEDKKVQTAWEMYKKALNNPRDRNHILKTFRANPTLAKYGIAYGAIYMEDPIARETLRQVGLNDMVLAQESASAQKVVQFLETKFADDVQVVGLISRFAPDAGAPLSLASWLKNKEAAESIENVDERWARENTTALDTAFSDVEQSESDAKSNDISAATPALWQIRFDKWKAYATALGNLKNHLSKFKPKNLKGEPFGRFQNYVNELIVQVNKQLDEVKQKVSLQKAALQKAKTASEAQAKQAEECVALLTKGKTELESKTTYSLVEFQGLIQPAGVAGKLLVDVKAKADIVPALAHGLGVYSFAIQAATRDVTKAAKLQTAQQKLQLDATRKNLIDEAENAKVFYVEEHTRLALEFKQFDNISLDLTLE